MNFAFVTVLFWSLSLSMQVINGMQWIKDNLKEALIAQNKFYELDMTLSKKLEEQRCDVQLMHIFQLSHFSLLQEESRDVETMLHRVNEQASVYLHKITQLANAIDLTFDVTRSPPVRPLLPPYVSYNPFTRLHNLLLQIQSLVGQYPPNTTLLQNVVQELHYQSFVAKYTLSNNLNLLLKQQHGLQEVIDSGSKPSEQT